MEKMIKFAKLDLFMIKPYLKRYLLLLLLISIPIVVSTENVYTMAFMAVFYGVVIISYPFVLSEKNNIENFYGTLSLNKKNIVKGRYIFALSIMVLFTVLAFACMVCGAIVLNQDMAIDEMIFILSSGFLAAIILLSIQIPIYFKVGYAKGKFFGYFPFILIGIAVPLSAKIFGSSLSEMNGMSAYIENNSIILSIIMVLCGLLIFEISNIISQKLYLNKSE